MHCPVRYHLPHLVRIVRVARICKKIIPEIETFVDFRVDYHHVNAGRPLLVVAVGEWLHSNHRKIIVKYSKYKNT